MQAQHDVEGAFILPCLQISEELAQLPALLQHLTGLFNDAKKRRDEAESELTSRQEKYKECKVLEPDENGWTSLIRSRMRLPSAILRSDATRSVLFPCIHCPL